MKIKPHQYQHYANGIARMKQCIADCKQPATVRGTIFSVRNAHDLSLFSNRFRILKHITNNWFYTLEERMAMSRQILGFDAPPSSSHTS